MSRVAGIGTLHVITDETIQSRFSHVTLAKLAAEGGAEWWLILPGMVLQGAAVVWLLRRFRRAVYT